ncbi:phage terminase large subunit [Brevundimonas vesicularis]|uniref:phage terminase large subunit n=1 Tax=Brevundimonas vesicularis TaxID=41276 RepID=UPI0028B007C1|nr:phage terminase large subunit [Brevundimonas vesicularis]
MDGAEPTVIRPQPGPQETFLGSSADIAIYGGAAGGGKTWALLMEPLRHIANPGFGAVFFRRSTVQVRNEGGLWDESEKLYPIIGATPREHVLSWEFPAGATVSFAHLEHDKTVLNWQGSQIPLICFDELTHFSQKQFWYMVSRNRSMCGVRPYIRATCNPDADSWVAEFIAWWIDQETGLPIPDRAGVVRWFVRINDALVWADDPAELEAKHPGIPPKSATFIPAKLTDNAALMAADPGYMANLLALPKVERERLLGGNWKIRAAAGLLFKRSWVSVVDAAPSDLRIVRGWDLAGTPKTEGNDPDWTAGTKIGKSRSTGRYIVLHHVRDRDTPHKVEALIANTASQDGAEVQVSLPQDPGQAGKAQVATLIKMLSAYTARATPETGDKETRFGPFSAQCEAGNVDVLRGPWNEEWFMQLESFPDAAHDDDADSTARAFNTLSLEEPSTVAMFLKSRHRG